MIAAPRRFKAEIGNFVTKRRSGRGDFGQRTGGQKRMLQTARQNVGPQPHVSLAAPFVPFGVPRRAAGAFRSFAALVEEGPGRGDSEAFAAVGLRKRLLGRAMPGKCAEGRERQFRDAGLEF